MNTVKWMVSQLLMVMLVVLVGCAIGGAMFGCYVVGSHLVPVIGVYAARFLLGLLAVVVGIWLVGAAIGWFVVLAEWSFGGKK